MGRRVGVGGLQLPGGCDEQVVGCGAVGGTAIVADPDSVVGGVDGDTDGTRYGTALEEDAGLAGGWVDLQDRRAGARGAVLVAEFGDEQVPGGEVAGGERDDGDATVLSGRWPSGFGAGAALAAAALRLVSAAALTATAARATVPGRRQR